MVEETADAHSPRPELSAAPRSAAGVPAELVFAQVVPAQVVTAAVLVVGNEILSGRTKDKNIAHIAQALTAIGIDLKEVRVVADEEPAIVAAVDALRERYTYVFTTGGIGPTHDDITADCIAKAFGVPLEHHPRAVDLLRARIGELNEARLRMARIPRGAALVENKLSAAPGFWIGNVIVMAGVPSVMQAMLDEVLPQLHTGPKLIAETVRADLREGDIGTELAAVAAAFPEVMIGSYPFMDEVRGPNTNVVLRARDPEQLAAAKAAVERMVEAVRAALAQRAAALAPPTRGANT